MITTLRTITAPNLFFPGRSAPQPSFQIPQAVRDFVGRADEIESLVDALQPSRHGIALIRGMVGVGKTQLAFKVAATLQQQFPDGLIRIDMRGTSQQPLTPDKAFRHVIQAMCGPTYPIERLESVEGEYQSVLAGKHVLILADDALDQGQVQPLTPPPGCALLVTSRRRFALPGAHTIELRELPAAEAELLLLRIYSEIAGAAPQLAVLCGYLPWALRLTAAHLEVHDTVPRARYLAQFEQELGRIAAQPDHDGDSLKELTAALRLSIAALDASARATLCQAGVFPGSFDEEAAWAVIALDGGPAKVSAALGRLRIAGLLDYRETRFRLHDLVRELALRQLSSPQEVRRRHAAHFVTIAERAQGLIVTHGGWDDPGLQLFDTEWLNIDAGWTALCDDPEAPNTKQLLLRYSRATHQVLDRYYDVARRQQLLELCVGLARNADDTGLLAQLLILLADAIVQTDAGTDPAQLDRARGWYHEAAALARRGAHPRDGQSECRAQIGIGCVAARTGDLQQAARASMLGLTIATKRDDHDSACLALSNLGNVFVAQSQIDEALRRYQEGCFLAITHGHHRILVKLWRDMGDAYMCLGRDPRLTVAEREAYWRQAAVQYRLSSTLAKLTGDRWGEHATHRHRSLYELETGLFDPAMESGRSARVSTERGTGTHR